MRLLLKLIVPANKGFQVALRHTSEHCSSRHSNVTPGPLSEALFKCTNPQPGCLGSWALGIHTCKKVSIWFSYSGMWKPQYPTWHSTLAVLESPGKFSKAILSLSSPLDIFICHNMRISDIKKTYQQIPACSLMWEFLL